MSVLPPPREKRKRKVAPNGGQEKGEKGKAEK